MLDEARGRTYEGEMEALNLVNLVAAAAETERAPKLLRKLANERLGEGSDTSKRARLVEIFKTILD